MPKANLTSLLELKPEMVPATKDTMTSIGGLDIYSVQDNEDYVNVIVYGDPGTGKTVLAGSAEAVEPMGPVLLIDCEGGTFSLRSFYPNIRIVRVKSWDDMQRLYDQLRRGDHNFKTVILDSLTEIQKFSMGEIMKDVVRKEPDRDPEVPSVREWGKSGEQIRRLVRGFRDLPMNVIFTALVNEDRNQKTGKVTFRPSLPGKLSREVPGYVDLVFYLYKRDIPNPKHVDGSDEPQTINARLLLTTATEEFVCKDRSNNLPPVIVEPTMQVIYNAVHNIVTEPSTETETGAQ